MNNVFANYERQQYKEKELIIVLNHDQMDLKKWEQTAKQYPNVSVFQLPAYITLGECYNFAIPKACYPYIVKFDDDDYYSAYYLLEAARGLQESGADVVGKSTVFIYYLRHKLLTLYNENKEFVYVRNRKELSDSYIVGATLVFRKDIYPNVSFEPINVGEDTRFLEACLQHNLLLYGTSRYNYVYIRYPRIGYHTSTFQEYKLLEKSKRLSVTDDFQDAIILPDEEIYKKKEE